jgi:hypothetical protein
MIIRAVADRNSQKGCLQMDSRHLMQTMIGVALILGAVEINKSWVSERQESNKANQIVELSKQEAERLKLFSRILLLDQSSPVKGALNAGVAEL